MSLIRNNGRKVYSLELVPVVSSCGLKIEIIEGFRKGLMYIFLEGSSLPLGRDVRSVMASPIVILMDLSNEAFRVSVSTCHLT
jgi:hypothetical protein